jgi:signal peptidase II
VVDRLFGRGHVIDWLELPHWRVFNLADSDVSVGVPLVLLSLRGVRYDGTRAGAADPPADRA